MKNENIVDQESFNGATLEIVEIPSLNGATTGEQAMALHFIKESNASLKMVRAKLNGETLQTEAGAFYYSKGNIQNEVKLGGITGVIGKLAKSSVTNEAAFNPTYTGNGVVVLEPSFGHYALLRLNNECIIVDKSMFFCSIGNVKVGASMQKNVSSAALGGEGLFQTKIEGNGVVALSLPAPIEEIEMFMLDNEQMQVDGNFAILRSGTIDFSVKKATKGIVGTLASGEGFLSTFSGRGQVWIAPTAPVYAKMSMGGMRNVQVGNRNNTQ